MALEYEDEDYFLPLEDQRVFGAGIRRKRVPFVRSGELSTTAAAQAQSGTNVADTYLSIVLKKQKNSNTSPSTPVPTNPASAFTSTSTSTSKEESIPPRTHSAPPTTELESEIPITSISKPDGHCEICNLPLSTDLQETSHSMRPHEASLAHQVCVQHSHPPSHLDRSRAGMRYLSTYGWDPDSRLGLGAAGREGIREPLKGRIKDDKAGLGSGLDKDGDPIKVPVVEPPKKVVRLNAKQMRKKDAEDRKKAEKMRNLFYKSDEVLRYLGEDA